MLSLLTRRIVAGLGSAPMSVARVANRQSALSSSFRTQTRRTFITGTIRTEYAAATVARATKKPATKKAAAKKPAAKRATATKTTATKKAGTKKTTAKVARKQPARKVAKPKVLKSTRGSCSFHPLSALETNRCMFVACNPGPKITKADLPPRMAVNAYVIFYTKYLAGLSAEHKPKGLAGVSQCAKEAAATWKTFTEAEKQVSPITLLFSLSYFQIPPTLCRY